MKFERLPEYPDVQLPERATKGSAGYDFFVAKDIVVYPNQIELVPTGVCAKIDKGYWLQLALRSSTPRKKHLMLANGIGIVDEDYYPGHIMFQVYNFGNEPAILQKGERIGQGVFVTYALTDEDNVNRIRQNGLGFGSTGDTDIANILFGGSDS